MPRAAKGASLKSRTLSYLLFTPSGFRSDDHSDQRWLKYNMTPARILHVPYCEDHVKASLYCVVFHVQHIFRFEKRSTSKRSVGFSRKQNKALFACCVSHCVCVPHIAV